MKITLKISLLFAFIIGAVAPSFAVKPTIEKESASIFEGMEVESVEDFLALTPKKIKAQTGEKMRLKDRLILKMAQRQVKKQQAKGEVVNFSEEYQRARGDFSLLWFILGLILPIIGLVLAWIFHGFGSRQMKWAFYGFLIAAALFFLFGVTI